MMYCPHCGTKNRDDASTCGSCGAALASAAVASGTGSGWNTAYYDNPLTPAASRRRVYAGFWIRFLAQFIDSLIGMSIGAIPGLVLLVVSGGSGFALVVLIVGLLSGIFLYHLIAVAYGGGFGVRTAGIRVIGVRDGARPGFARSAVRLVARLVLASLPAVGGVVAIVENLWMVKDETKQTWHDKVAGTCVVER